MASFVDQLELADKRHAGWAHNIATSVENARSLHHLLDTEGRAKFEQMTKKLRALELEQTALVSELGERSALQESLALLRSRRDELENSIGELSEILKDSEKMIEDQLIEYNGALAENATKNALILDGIQWYEKHLGFQVQTTKNNGLWIILTKVLPSDLDRAFSFSIRHDKQQNIYTLLECSPRLSNSTELVSELNSTNDLKRFIFNMRNAFRAEVKKGDI